MRLQYGVVSGRHIFIGTHQFTCIACVGDQKIILTFLFTTNWLFDGTNHSKINAVHLISVHSGPDQPMQHAWAHWIFQMVPFLCITDLYGAYWFDCLKWFNVSRNVVSLPAVHK